MLNVKWGYVCMYIGPETEHRFFNCDNGLEEKEEKLFNLSLDQVLELASQHIYLSGVFIMT